MLSNKTAVYDSPAVGARILEFANQGNLPPYCVVENLDLAASVAIHYEESNDGSNWTTIAGTTATVNPGESNAQQVVSAQAFVALHTAGGSKILVSVQRQVDGAPLNLGSA